MSSQQKTILITGTSGFIGRYVARLFAAEGWLVIGIDIVAPENAPLADLSTYLSTQLPGKKLASLLEKEQPNVCIHCAGRASIDFSVKQPLTDYHSNTLLTAEMLEALRLHAPGCRFINLSSAAVYGNPQSLPVDESHAPAPISPYGFHKWQSDLLCQEYAEIYGLQTASVRIFSAYGVGLRRQVMWDICHKAITQKRLVLQGTGKESRDFVHGTDIARALMTLSTTNEVRGETYNLGSGREVNISELAQLILDKLGYDFQPEFSGTLPEGTPLNWKADISRLRALGFSSTISLEQGVTAFVHWCKSELIGL